MQSFPPDRENFAAPQARPLSHQHPIQLINRYYYRWHGACNYKGMLGSTAVTYGRYGTFETPRVERTAAASQNQHFWGSDGFGFSDILDIVNPLQNLPVVSDIYRKVTGDATSPGSKVAGGALFGGVGGLIAGFFSSTVEQVSGSTPVVQAMNFISGETTEVEAANNNTPLERAMIDWSQPVPSKKVYDTAAYLRKYNEVQQFAEAQRSGRIDIAA